MVTHRRLAPRDHIDFFPTPAWGTEALLHFESFEGEILEPCRGDGAMAKVLSDAGYEVTATAMESQYPQYLTNIFI